MLSSRENGEHQRPCSFSLKLETSSLLWSEIRFKIWNEWNILKYHFCCTSYLCKDVWSRASWRTCILLLSQGFCTSQPRFLSQTFHKYRTQLAIWEIFRKWTQPWSEMLGLSNLLSRSHWFEGLTNGKRNLWKLHCRKREEASEPWQLSHVSRLTPWGFLSGLSGPKVRILAAMWFG